MDLSRSNYNDVTVRIPYGANIDPLRNVAKSMGWVIVLPSIYSEEEAKPSNTITPSQLRGLFRLRGDFDYKKELHQALCGKYDIEPTI